MSTDQRLVQAAIRAWTSSVARAAEEFARLHPEDFERTVAPGKNRLIYLYGHLIAIHDRMIPLLGIGERACEALDAPFITAPDSPAASYPTLDELRAAWRRVHAALESGTLALTPEAWSEAHTAVSADDFDKSPWRNRFSVLLSRTSHLAYHMGQIRLARGASEGKS